MPKEKDTKKENELTEILSQDFSEQWVYYSCENKCNKENLTPSQKQIVELIETKMDQIDKSMTLRLKNLIYSFAPIVELQKKLEILERERNNIFLSKEKEEDEDGEAE